MNNQDLNLKDIKQSIDKVIPIIHGMLNMQFANIPCAIPGLFGDAGIGKTAQIEKMCIDNDWNLLNVHYGLKPLEEISGLPDFGETVTIKGNNIKKTNWTLPDILSDAYELVKNEKPLVIFLDDFHTASPGNMALGYEMFTSKKLRGYPFPEQTAFILAANVSGKKSLANPIPSPIINRLAKFDVSVNFEYWKKQFAIPNNVNKKIIHFLSNPKYSNYFQTEEIVNNPWCSARSWTNFSTLLNAIEQYMPNYIDTIDPYYLAKSFLDDEAALVFSKYYVLYDQINVIDIFKNEAPIIIPEKINEKYVFILACVDEFINLYAKEKNIEKITNIICEIIIQMAKTNTELSIVGLKEIMISQQSLKLKNMFSEIKKLLLTKNAEIGQKLFNDILKLV